MKMCAASRQLVKLGSGTGEADADIFPQLVSCRLRETIVKKIP